MSTAVLQPCYQQLDLCLLKDRQGFYRRLRKLQKNLNKPGFDESLNKLGRDLELSVEKVKLRRQQAPALNFPEELPISQKRDKILEVIRANQVTILCGETGSGKTTQLPKICLQLGLGLRGLIGHTQPRRLAARSVATRIAEELHTELGQQVGFKVRFSDQTSERSYIKLMTDGILLAECHHDPYLNQYDTIIIDEAHERSLNIDFLLGYIKQLIARRPDLKVIITSATIDPERFSRHFNNAPIINVSGRTYPVEVLYRPLHKSDDAEEDNDPKDMQQGIVDAVLETTKIDRGDILVFLAGERDIRETTEALKKQQLQHTEILPLLARLSASEQNKIFKGSSQRRIILATNVAETSLTVPGIKYVIDTGLARISRYSWRSKIQRLPIEKISQASANQRKGRCGRVSNGICIRLYDEADFIARSEFTQPEIQRTNLAAVILQMENLQLGHIDDFPFVEAPDQRLITDGYKLLFELGAIDENSRLTRIGKKLARLPIDPRLGRMLIEAEQESSLNEVLIIIAALATQDPRERPMTKQQAADQKHQVWKDVKSDFVFFLNLWDEFHAQKKALSNNQLRKWCAQNYLSWMRIREWSDTYRQIKKMLQELNISFGNSAGNNNVGNSNSNYDAIHRALITGLLGNLGFKQENKEYLGARNKKFQVFPGSSLFKNPPKWLMAAEIVETSRVFARTNAKIEPQWVEQKAEHLLKRSYSNPHWEKKSAQVVASEQTTLYGLIINPEKNINYGKVDPRLSREIFIQCALVQQDFDCKAEFFIHNKKLIAQLEKLEAKSRRQDILVDDAILFQFYDQRIPEHIHNGVLFNTWLKACSKTELDKLQALFLSEQDLMQQDAGHVCGEQFPDHLEMNEISYPLDYHFDINHHHDGITLTAPLAALHAINAQRCEWLVPGMLREKIIALLRSLPKSIRRNFVPAPNFADACMEALEPSTSPLTAAMSKHLKVMTGMEIPYDAWRTELIDDHLFMNFRVIDSQGKVVAQSRDLPALKEQLSTQENGRTTHSDAVPARDSSFAPPTKHPLEQDNVGAEAIDLLAQSIKLEQHGVTIKAYPALVIEGKSVALRLINSQQQAEAETLKGLRRLFIQALPPQIKHLKNNLPDIQNLCLKYADFGRCDELKQDLIDVVIEQCFMQQPIQSRQDFTQALTAGRSELMSVATQWCQLLAGILEQYRAVKKALKNPPLSMLDIISDIQNQLTHLFPPHPLLNIDKQWLAHYPRYLSAISKRLDKAQGDPVRDRQHRLQISTLWDAYLKRQHSLEKQHIISPQLEHYRWMLEEYRVSLFAQELKTQFPVSEKRLKAYWNEISDV
ncbi:MAG: ATP-dependent RNA helicase HrpA [Gammaproteobacteria bacterium]|nr:ATP-dependent RNA helicase HrpA [Gammaproteobacteria bacterium]